MNYNQAFQLATEAHEGQIRENTGEPYIIHPIAVADKFTDEDHKIVAILHDVIEDSNYTVEDLKNRGLRLDLAHTVELLTHTKKQTYLSYLLRLKHNHMAKQIKIEDLNHNLLDVRKKCSKCSTDKYIMALYILNN